MEEGTEEEEGHGDGGPGGTPLKFSFCLFLSSSGDLLQDGSV